MRVIRVTSSRSRRAEEWMPPLESFLAPRYSALSPMPRREPPPRAVLVASARRLIEWLARHHVSLQASGVGTYPHALIAQYFEAWAEALDRAPANLLEPRALHAILQEALVEAQLRVSKQFASRLGASQMAKLLRDFAGSLDLAQFGEARGATYAAWFSRTLALPEPPEGIPTPGDETLREHVARLTPEERTTTTELELESGKAILRNLSPLQSLPNLRKLIISDADLLVDLSPLGKLTALEDLRLEGHRIVDLRALAPLQSLRRLRLRTGQTDLAALGALESLEELEVSDDVPVGDLSPLARLPLRRLWLGRVTCDLAPLAGMRALTDLRLTWTAQTSNLAAIAERTDLRVLDLSQLPFESIAPLAGLTALVKLTLHSCKALKDVRPIAGMTSLEELDLSLSGSADLTALAGLPNLRVLDLFGRTLPGLPPLAELPRLEHLTMLCSELRNLQGLENARALRKLEIGSTRVSDLTPLSTLEALEELHIDSQGAIADIQPLGALRNLKRLSLDGASVRDLGPLAGLSNLEYAFFPRTLIESVEPLAALPNLRFVDVSQCHRLETLLPLAACSQLTKIDSTDCERLRGPRTVEELRSWRPPRPAKTYPAGPVAAARPGALTTLDARNHLPKSPPERWSVPERSAPGDPEHYAIDADGVLVQISLLGDEDHPRLMVAIAPRSGQKASDKLAARILRRFRACDPFVEMEDEDWLFGPLEHVRAFAARAHSASPDTWGAIRERRPSLRVEPCGNGVTLDANDAADVRHHLPAPLPDGWRLERTGDPEDVSCRIVTPEWVVVAEVRLREGSDVAMLNVGIFPPAQGAPYVCDDRARACLERFRVKGAFEETLAGPFAASPGARVFSARVGS